MVMTYTGAITYAPALTGSATGTPITCTLAGWGNNTRVDVDCDTSRSIANSGGCCGDTNKSVTAFTAYGTGNNTDGPASCNGIGGTRSLRFNVTAAGTATLYFGSTMDATHVKIGGTYLLSNHATGVFSLRVKSSGTAVTQTADLSVVFSSLVGFTSRVDMRFGDLGFTLPVGASDFVNMGTNGTASYNGSFVNLGGTVSAGSVLLNNVQNGVTVEIYCDTTAKLTKSGASGSSIQVTGIETRAENARGAYGTGSACNGIGGAAATTMVFASGTSDEFFLGGKLNGATAVSFADGNFSTANAGGDDIQVTVLNQ